MVLDKDHKLGLHLVLEFRKKNIDFSDLKKKQS